MDYDYTEVTELQRLVTENIKWAGEYKQCRESYADARVKLDLAIANGYSNGTIDNKMAIEKAYLFLSAQNNEFKQAYIDMIKMEQMYKGWDKVIQTIQNKVSLGQTLAKANEKLGG